MRYAVVTGSTRGIGYCIAKQLLSDGYFVILNYSKSEESADAASKELKSISNNFVIIKHDMSNCDNIGLFCFKVMSISSSIDVLILNAGVTSKATFGQMTLSEWNNVFQTNVTVPFFIVQGLSKIINNYGKIIFIGSILGIHPHAQSIAYGVSKSAAHMMSKYLVKYFKEKNVTVNTIAPGFTETDWQKDKQENIKSRIKSKIAQNRFAWPEEIANGVNGVINNDYINGQVIVIDGGYCCE